MRAEDLVGTWIIESFLMEDCATGRRTRPWGEQPSGTVVFGSDGLMFALITADGRSAPTGEADEAAAFRSMLSYSGHYRVEPPQSARNQRRHRLVRAMGWERAGQVLRVVG